MSGQETENKHVCVPIDIAAAFQVGLNPSAD